MSDLDSSAVGLGPRNVAGRNTRNYTLVGVLFGLAFPLAASAVLLVQQRLPLSLSTLAAIQSENPLMWMIDTAPLFLGALAAMAGLRQDALAERNRELAERGRELTNLKTNLEDRVADRMQELEARNLQTRAAVQITRRLAEVRDTAALLTTAAGLIGQSFPDLEADIYLLDSRGDTAILEASSSPAGTGRVKQGHSVNVGDESIVGQVAAQGRTIVSNASRSPVEGGADGAGAGQGASEMAIALVSRGRILGVLNVRYDDARAMKETDTEVFQLLADQLAGALDNAHLLEQARGSVEQLEQLSGERTRTVWQEYLSHRNVAYHYSPKGVRSTGTGLEIGGAETVAVPLIIRGQQIGSLAMKRRAQPWAEGERDLAEKVATQVALALENTRLLEETRNRALYEQRASAISDRLGQSVDMDTLLQTAARELASLPEVSDATVFLGPAPERGEDTP